MNVTRALLAAALGVAALAGCAAAPAAPLAAVPITSVAGWAPVTDAGTGVRADLPGPARQESEPVIAPDREVRGVAYHALEPTGRVEAVLHISPLPGDERVAPQQAAERTAYLLSGELSRSAPLVAEGHPAVDARIDGWARTEGSGRGTLLLRIIDTPGFEVTVEANGDLADAALVREVFDRVCRTLRIP
jgi:hypothetical protein